MTPARLVTAMCTAEVVGMLGTSTFAALLPYFMQEWSLTNTEAGWISAIYLAGYAASVPVLVSLTDRVDPRHIYLPSAALGMLASLGFALFTDGFWDAMLYRGLAGVSLAGTYMPGLRALSDRIEGPKQPRAVSFYTSSFGIGTAASFLMSGQVSAWFGWRWAFIAAAAGSVVALWIVGWAIGPRNPDRHTMPTTALLDFRPVLRNRSAMAYILCYAVHNWELFVIRSWVVALLAFTLTTHGDEARLLTPTLIATALTLLGVWASITGNELAMRYGRRRVIFLVMLSSVILCSFIGFTSAVSYMLVALLCLLHGIVVAGESAALTAGAIGTATQGYRGLTMALHSTLGFSFAFLGPLAFGWILDLAGGDTVMAWGLGYASVAVVMAMGMVALLVLRPQELPGDYKASGK